VDLRLEFGQTYLAGLSGKLLDGIAELIWNAIDGEARSIAVELGESDGAVVEVRVIDNGHGIDFASAQREFGVFGDSWKAGAARSKTGLRTLHGRAGRGRLSVFKHGGTAVWRTVSELSGSREALTITVAHDAMDHARLGDPTPTTAEPGTTVTLSGFATPPAGIQGSQAYERLLTMFAIATRVEDVAISYAGRRLDVADALLDDEDILVRTGTSEAVLTLLEWNRKIKPAGELHLCDEQGVSRYALPSDVDGHGIPFTAYLRWPRMVEFDQQLTAAGLDQGPLGEIVREATTLLQRALDRRHDRRRRDIIDTWRRDGDYPFDGEPSGDGERVTRETFELVAVEAAAVINSSKPRARKLSLRLLKEALEHNPGQIHHIFDQVLDLDQESVDRLSRLLSHTPLSRVIAASAAIAERLEFLGAITDLTTDRVHRRHLLERSQLHKLVEAEPWIFGEEYALAASDRGLTEVLRQNLTLLGRSDLAEQIGEEVLDADGHRAIVDLLFSGVVLGADDQQTMLVVELKRPSVSIGDDELAQLRKYALAVHEHDRFDLNRTRFDFWAISTKITQSVKYQRKNSGPDIGQVNMFPELPIRVWVKTWAEVLHTARHRLRYVQQQLDYAPTEEQSFDYLRRTYADRLPPTVPRGESRDAAA
jgi:Histidine kinase-, DNA gyrase B-, and HSP90-like ATPase